MASKRIQRYAAVVAIVCLFLMLAATGPCLSQYVRHITAHPLLRASAVYQASRDSRGFLWFCTDHGLVKFNGKSPEYFTRKNGLEDNMVFNVYEDRQGRIWAFCYNGRYCYIDGDSVHNERNDPFLAALPHAGGFLTCMAQAGGSDFRFGFSDRSVLRIRGGCIQPLERNSDVRTSLIVKAEDLSFTTVPAVNVLADDRLHRLSADTAGLKVYRGDRLTWSRDDPSLNVKTVNDLYLSGTGELLVSTINGVDIISLATGRRSQILDGVRVSSCCADMAGNFWITTVNNGLFVLHREGERIRRLEGFDGLEWTVVNDDRIVFTKDHVQYELLQEGDSIRAARIAGGVEGYYNPVLRSGNWSIFYDTREKHPQLISTYGGVEKSRKVEIALKEDLLFFKKMFVSGGGDLFAYGSWIVYHYRRNQDRLKFVDTLLFPPLVTAAAQDRSNGNVYFSAGEVLYRFDFSRSAAVPLFRSPVLRQAASLAATDSGMLICTRDERLYRLYPVAPRGRLSNVGLPFAVRSLLPISGGRSYVFADDGHYLMRLSGGRPLTEEVVYPFPSSDYEQLSFLGNKCLVKLDGKFYYFDSALLNRRKPAGTVYLKRLVVNGREYPQGDIDIRNTAKLNIQVALGILDFTNSVHGIRYRLRGPEGGTWQHTTATEIAFLLQKAGVYQIEILPEHGQGAALRIRMQVHTPFLRSTAFLILCCLLVLAIGAGCVVVVLRYRKRHFLRELSYLRLEHRAINALLNPHFIFNSINNIQQLINSSEGQDAAEYLAVLSKLIRQNLENLQFNLIPLENELGLILRYVQLQNLRFEGLIDLTIETGGVDPEGLFVPPLLVHTFFENAIVHGFRRKDRPFQIAILLQREDADYLIIAIRDNGVGIDEKRSVFESQHRSSMGISFNRKRLARLSEFYKLRQSIELRDLRTSGDSGTEVRIRIFSGLRQLFGQPLHAVH